MAVNVIVKSIGITHPSEAGGAEQARYILAGEVDSARRLEQLLETASGVGLKEARSMTVRVYGREVAVPHSANGVALCDFDTLCAQVRDGQPPQSSLTLVVICMLITMVTLVRYSPWVRQTILRSARRTTLYLSVTCHAWTCVQETRPGDSLH